MVTCLQTKVILLFRGQNIVEYGGYSTVQTEAKNRQTIVAKTVFILSRIKLKSDNLYRLEKLANLLQFIIGRNPVYILPPSNQSWQLWRLKNAKINNRNPFCRGRQNIFYECCEPNLLDARNIRSENWRINYKKKINVNKYFLLC